MAFQRVTWRTQRVGWVLLVLLIGAALLGLFSSGPLSSTTSVSSTGDWRVEHQRFYRLEASSSMTVVPPGNLPGNEIELVLSHSLLRALTIESLQPRPSRASSQADGVHLWFQTAPGPPAQLHLALRPTASGIVSGSIAIAGRGEIWLKLIVYP